jgi:hypothetical protein
MGGFFLPSSFSSKAKEQKTRNGNYPSLFHGAVFSKVPEKGRRWFRKDQAQRPLREDSGRGLLEAPRILDLG